MDFMLIYELVNVNWTHAIASTLLHSIWEGTIAAILSGLIILCTKKCRASLRYALHSFVFLFFLIAVTYTFIKEFQTDVVIPANVVAIPENTRLLSNETGSVVSTPGNGVNAAFVMLQINYFLSKYSTVIVFVWLSVFFVRFCSLLTGMQRIHRLRKQESKRAPSHWKHRLDVLACKIGITQHLDLLESGRISVPMVIGYFKPVILIPFGLICRLPSEEIEAILLHELAHIRRRDYLVNLLQSIAENIFFFHPCILWISSLIREERENCCDDIAVQVTNDREQYVHALISFQEYNLAASASPAIAFAGTRHRLLDRVRRILNHENKKLNQMEKMILMGSMFVLTSISVISTNDSQAQQRERPHRESFKREQSRSEDKEIVKEREALYLTDGEFRHVSTNTSFNDGDRVSTITAVDEEGKKYRLKNVNGKIVSLSIDGEAIDEEDFNEYRNVIKNIERVSAVASEKSKLQRQKSLERRNESETIRELRREELRRRELEIASMGDRNKQEAEKLMYRKMQEQQQENDRLNRERLEREHAFNAEQQRLRELLESETEANRNRNRNNSEDLEYELNTDGTSKRKLKIADLQEYKLQLRERELMQRAEEDADRRKTEQQRLREVVEKARDMQERNAFRIAQQRKLQQQRYYDQIQRNREIYQRNLERIAQQRKAQQEHYREQLARQREELQFRHHADPIQRPKKIVQTKPKSFLESSRSLAKNDEISRIIDVLEEEEIIDSRDHLSFTLTDDHLIVNGRRQSSELHERLKDRYIQKSGDHFSYFKDGNTTRTTIQKN